MSAFTIFTAALACVASFANAYTTPTGDGPVGNAFSAPGLGSTVPVGKPFTITWAPSTPGSVTLVLLKGAAQSLSVVGPIAEKIDNTGSYVWTPSADLTEGPTSTTGYGIQLIVDSSGQYQYTTQFGISKDGHSAVGSTIPNQPQSARPVTSSAAAAPSDAPSDSPSVSAPPASVAPASDAPTTASPSAPAVVTLSQGPTTLITAAPSSYAMSSRTSSSGPSRSTGAVASASQTGAAVQIKSGLFGLVAVAGAAVMVL